MFYVIERQCLSDDLYKVIDSYAPLMGGDYIYISKGTLKIFKGYRLLVSNSEYIDVDKLKEILVLKQLKD